MHSTKGSKREPPGKVRIIGGEHRGRKLAVPLRPGLRPTPDRVRETLFNWLGQRLDGKACLDLFAGSGVLGFEAASRGAARVVMLEQDREAYRALEDSKALLSAGQVELRFGDGLRYLDSGEERFDVVFLDPPFEADLFDKALAAAVPAVRPQGFIYLEAPSGWEGEALARHGLELVRHLKAGAVHGHLLRRTA